jgi:hypothetical protein
VSASAERGERLPTPKDNRWEPRDVILVGNLRVGECFEDPLTGNWLKVRSIKLYDITTRELDVFCFDFRTGTEYSIIRRNNAWVLCPEINGCE